MKRIAIRSISLWILVAVLLGGCVLFALDYWHDAESWAMHPASPHMQLTGSTITDREGKLLLTLGRRKEYGGSATLRQSMLHWLGDRQGNVQTPILSEYSHALSGYDSVNGLYRYGSSSMTLTLSAELQQAALEAMGEHKGTLALYHYKTGQILCAVSTPGFDPDQLPELDSEQYEGVYLNRFTQSRFIPGSVFKIATTAAALECVPDIEQRVFTCAGTYVFGSDQVTCERAHGKLGLKEAMMRSCNCAFAQIGLLVGAQRLQTYVDKYAVLKPVTFDGITTAPGSISLLGQADVQVAWSAIGQHKDQINPCSFLSFVGAIANGGQGVRPYVVESVQVGDRITYQAQITPLERIMDAEIAKTLQEFMRNNVTENYGAENFPGLTVCAKSGTAEVGAGKKPNALFTGFIADEGYPFAFFVLVENGGYGKQVCMPILQQVLEALQESYHP